MDVLRYYFMVMQNIVNPTTVTDQLPAPEAPRGDPGAPTSLTSFWEYIQNNLTILYHVRQETEHQNILHHSEVYAANDPAEEKSSLRMFKQPHVCNADLIWTNELYKVCL